MPAPQPAVAPKRAPLAGSFVSGALLVWAILLVEAFLLLLACRYGDLLQPGNAARFVMFVLGAGVCYLAAASCFNHAAAQSRPALLWVASAGLRLAVLSMPPGPELWRYLWEAKIQLHGFNPYLVSPDDPALKALRDAWWGAIRARHAAAIDLPGGEWILAHLAGAARWYALGPAWLPLLFKVLFALADLGTVWVLLKLNTGSGRYRATAWYAWNPMVVAMFAGAGHFDSLMVFALVSAAWMLHRANPLDQCKPAWSWALSSAALLGVAISIKPAPLVLLPIWAMALRRRSIVLGLSLAIPLALALPYGGIEVVTHSFRTFLDVTRYNDMLWWAVERLGWTANGHNTRYIVVLALTLLALCWRFRNNWRAGALWSMGAALVLAPVFYPWYVIWILPFACWRKATGWFVLALTVALALLPWSAAETPSPAGLPPVWVRFLILAPAAGWWAVQALRNFSRSQRKPDGAPI